MAKSKHKEHNENTTEGMETPETHEGSHDVSLHSGEVESGDVGDEHIYRGHGVIPVRQAQPEDPEYPRGADPTTLVLVQDFRGRHHSVNVTELEPPMAPYPETEEQRESREKREKEADELYKHIKEKESGHKETEEAPSEEAHAPS
jgi:hypothetical protein